MQKHVFVTPGNSHLKWDPSRRKNDNDFVDVGSIRHLVPGLLGQRVTKLAASSEQPAVRKFVELRAGHPYEVTSGWLDKLGGAHGGRKNWQRRWCVLLGTTLYYFANPADPDEKGHINVAGSTTAAGDDGTTFTLTWAEDSAEHPTREFRAESPADRDRWVTSVKRIVRLDRARQGKSRPDSKLGAAMAKTSGGAAGADKGLMSDDNLKARAREVAALPVLEPTALAFTVATGSAEDPTECVSFICASMREYDLWYAGLMHASAQRRNLNPERRISEYTLLLEEHADDAALQVLLGEQYEATGQQDDAVAAYRTACELQPQLPSARKACGKLLLRHEGSIGEALEHLECAAVMQDSEDFETLLLLAEARTLLAQHLPAAAAFQQASVVEPSSIAAHVGAGDAYRAAGDDAAAEAAYATALSLLRKAVAAGRLAESGVGKAQMDEDLLRKHAAALATCGRAADAAKLHKEAEEVEVAHAPQHAARAAALAEPGRWREAVRHWDIVLRAKPDDASTLLSTSTAYYNADADRLAAAPATAPSSTPAGVAGAAASAARGAAGVAASSTSRAAHNGDEGEDGGGSDGEGSDEDVVPGAQDPLIGDVAATNGAHVGADVMADVVGVVDESASTGPRRRLSVPASRFSHGLSSGAVSEACAGAVVRDMPVPAGAPVFGSLAVDKLSGRELLTRAEELVVRVLAMDAASAHANILCAKVFERLADVERAELRVVLEAGGYSAPDGTWQAVDASVPLDEQLASSGWTPSSRLQRVEAFLQYVTAAYTETRFAEAPYLLASVYKRLGRLDEAAAQVKLALERHPGYAEAADLLKRVTRLQAGKSEMGSDADGGSSGGGGGSRSRRGSSDAPTKPRGEVSVEFGHELEIARVASGSKDERDAAFFAAMKEKKRKEEESKKKKEEDMVRSMTPEERAQHDAAMRDKGKHDQRKERMLKGQLGAYSGGSTRANLLGRGGRGGRSGRGLEA